MAPAWWSFLRPHHKSVKVLLRLAKVVTKPGHDIIHPGHRTHWAIGIRPHSHVHPLERLLLGQVFAEGQEGCHLCICRFNA